MGGALDDIKVVDLTRTLAGPFCTMLLGDMGADVVKIEEPCLGDEIRHWTPFWNGESTQFVTFNRNKRSITVNLKEPEGVELVRRLAAAADVMIESFRAGTLERMGLGYDDISAINPGIVYCSISGYGRTGPMADMPGYDLIIQAYSGLMHLTGEPDGLPQRVGFSLVDLFTGDDGLRHRGYRPAAARPDRQGPVGGGRVAGRSGCRPQLPRHPLSGNRRGPGAYGLRPPQPGAIPEFRFIRWLLHSRLRQTRGCGSEPAGPSGVKTCWRDPRFTTKHRPGGPTGRSAFQS